MLNVAFLTLFVFALSLSCVEQSHCSKVTKEQNYVKCVSGTCECNYGFSGNASVEFPCQCLSPYLPVMRDGEAYCTSFRGAVFWKQQEAKKGVLMSIVGEFYNNLKLSKNVDYLFSKDYVNRMDSRSVWNNRDRVSSISFRKMSVEYNIVSVIVDIKYMRDGKYYDVTQTETFIFNSENKIQSINVV